MTTVPKESAAAVLLYPGCIVAEVTEVASRLSMAGVDVLWASPDGQPLTDLSGLAVVPKTGVDALLHDETRIDAVVVPGGDPEAVMGQPIVRRLISQVADADGTVAGICAGVLVLADAGVLVGRKATHNYRPPWTPPETEHEVADFFTGVHVEPDRSVGVVVDGPVITALPNATAEFSLSICHRLGIYDEARAQLLTKHLQGNYLPELFAAVSDRFPTDDLP